MSHTHAAPQRTLRARQRTALRVALYANGAFMVAELVGGIAFGSLALLADAAHMLTDTVGLAIALVGARLVERAATHRHTFGLQRAEVLAAQANGILILGTAAYIFYEAFRRIGAEPDIYGPGLLVIASAGLAVNLGTAALLARVRGESLNVRGAYVHLLSDAAGSVGAIAAGVAIIVWNAAWVDTVASVIIGLVVLWAAWGLLRDTTHVLLEGVPKVRDIGAVRDLLASAENVSSVHVLHVWNLASDRIALSAHIVFDPASSVAETQTRIRALKKELASHFGVAHATIEIEADPCGDCDPCQPPTD